MTAMSASVGTMTGIDWTFYGLLVAITFAGVLLSVHYLTNKSKSAIIRMARKLDGITVLGLTSLSAALDAIAFVGIMGWFNLQVLSFIFVVCVAVAIGLVRWHQYWFRRYLEEAKHTYTYLGTS
jgi:hypothetical protein